MTSPPPLDDPSLPSGVVTFVMTDVEGSGSQWTARPKEMAGAVR